MSEERGEDFKSPGGLRVSAEAFWSTDDEVGVSDFRLAFASVLSFCAAEPVSFDARERGVEVVVLFVVHPVFFGWEDLAEEDRKSDVFVFLDALFPEDRHKNLLIICLYKFYVVKDKYLRVLK